MANYMEHYYKEMSQGISFPEPTVLCTLTGQECKDGDCRVCSFALIGFNRGYKGGRIDNGPE